MQIKDVLSISCEPVRHFTKTGLELEDDCGTTLSGGLSCNS